MKMFKIKSEFYEIARDLPSSLELNEEIVNSNNHYNTTTSTATTNNNDHSGVPSTTGAATAAGSSDHQNVEIIGTHLLVPHNSISTLVYIYMKKKSHYYIHNLDQLFSNFDILLLSSKQIGT